MVATLQYFGFTRFATLGRGGGTGACPDHRMRAGVFFREETRRLAASFGATGWVRNRVDGRVEALFEGEVATVVRLLDWCHAGPAQARVSDVVITRGAATGEYAGFSVRQTPD